MPALAATIFKQLPATIKGNAKGFTATITTDAVDRDDEVLVPQGMDSTDWEKNPILLWLHDSSEPVGHGTALRRRPREIEADFVFTPRPSNYVGEWFPDYARGMVEAGTVRAVSVRALPKENGARMANARDREIYGQRCRSVVSKWDLIEVSLVPLPCNQEALISAVRKGFITREAVRLFAKVEVPELPARAKERRRRVVVSVPAFGTHDFAKAAIREEVRRLQGRMHA